MATPADTSKPAEAPPPLSLKAKLQRFANKPIGYVVMTALIVLIVGGSLFYMQVLLGAIVMLLVGFGLPIYLGWNVSFRNMFILALVITVASPPIWSALSTNELYTPYNPQNSADGSLLSGSVLQNAHVSPFTYPPASGNSYHYMVSGAKVKYNGSAVNLTSVTLWITDCLYDGLGATNGCVGGSGANFYHNYTYAILPANASRPFNVAYFNESLPSNQVMYYFFTANYSFLMHGFKGYGFSCLGTVLNGEEGCGLSRGIYMPLPGYWNEGPITGSWGTVYGLLLPAYYEVMAGLGGLLALVILIYRYLKLRERRQQKLAKDSATGSTSDGEVRCPKCQAVVKGGESFCWKCGSSLEAPASQPSLPLK